MFASLLITGPFSILLGFDGGMMALNDRLRLEVSSWRKGDMFYPREECAIRVIEPKLDKIWSQRSRNSNSTIRRNVRK